MSISWQNERICSVFKAPKNLYEGRLFPIKWVGMLLYLNADYDIPRAIVLCQDNIRTKGKIVYLPIYMTMFLKRQQPDEQTIRFDASGCNL